MRGFFVLERGGFPDPLPEFLPEGDGKTLGNRTTLFYHSDEF